MLTTSLIVFMISVLPICFAAPLRMSGCGQTSSNLTSAQILKFAPTANACDCSTQFADECRTATQVAPLINAAFQLFGIHTVGEKAALASLMSFETGDFKFDRNHFPAPGNPGQGTRNLMQFPFVMKYAQNTTSTVARANKLAPNLSTVSDEVKDQVLALMLPDHLSFAAAAWFLKNSGQCDQSVIKALQGATEAGWETYITKCVGTTVTDERKSVYLAALSALQ